MLLWSFKYFFLFFKIFFFNNKTLGHRRLDDHRLDGPRPRGPEPAHQVGLQEDRLLKAVQAGGPERRHLGDQRLPAHVLHHDVVLHQLRPDQLHGEKKEKKIETTNNLFYYLFNILC